MNPSTLYKILEAIKDGKDISYEDASFLIKKGLVERLSNSTNQLNRSPVGREYEFMPATPDEEVEQVIEDMLVGLTPNGKFLISLSKSDELGGVLSYSQLKMYLNQKIGPVSPARNWWGAQLEDPSQLETVDWELRKEQKLKLAEILLNFNNGIYR